MNRLCCFGAGGHGKVVALQWMRRTGGQACFADENVAVGSQVNGIRVSYDSLAAIGSNPLIVTIGNNQRRREIQAAADAAGMEIVCFVADPEFFFAEPPGKGSVVLAGAVVNPGASIGDGVIVNSGAIVEHDCTVGAFAHVSPGARLAGAACVGEDCWVGTGAILLPGVAIARATIIGAGAVVTGDVTTPGIYAGVPARRIGDLPAPLISGVA